MLTAKDAVVAQTTVGRTYFSFMKLLKNGKVLYMFTTDIFVHAQDTSIFAFHSLPQLPSILLRNALLVDT